MKKIKQFFNFSKTMFICACKLLIINFVLRILQVCFPKEHNMNKLKSLTCISRSVTDGKVNPCVMSGRF